MRWILTLVLCLLTGFIGVGAQAAGEIAAEPSAVTPGQAATLKWYFGGVKITVSGGGLAPGTLVTGKQSLVVRPKKTTKYLFDVYYHPELPADKQAKGTGKVTHVQYAVTVEVVSATMPGMLSYKGSHGWRVNYQSGWTPMPNREGSDDVIFFQQEEDAVERLAVSIASVKAQTTAELMEEVRADIPSNYTNYTLVSQTETTHQNLPAIVLTFTGNTAAHPGTRTETMMIIFVNGDKGYVVSTRASADRFSVRRAVMEKMLASFTLTGKITPPSAKQDVSGTTPAKTTAKTVSAADDKK